MQKIFFCICPANDTELAQLKISDYRYFGFSIVNVRPLACLAILVCNETRQNVFAAQFNSLSDHYCDRLFENVDMMLCP